MAFALAALFEVGLGAPGGTVDVWTVLPVPMRVLFSRGGFQDPLGIGCPVGCQMQQGPPGRTVIPTQLQKRGLDQATLCGDVFLGQGVGKVDPDFIQTIGYGLLVEGLSTASRMATRTLPIPPSSRLRSNRPTPGSWTSMPTKIASRAQLSAIQARACPLPKPISTTSEWLAGFEKALAASPALFGYGLACIGSQIRQRHVPGPAVSRPGRRTKLAHPPRWWPSILCLRSFRVDPGSDSGNPPSVRKNGHSGGRKTSPPGPCSSINDWRTIGNRPESIFHAGALIGPG